MSSLSPRSSRVVVLGCGFTGEAIVRAASARGHRALATTRVEANALALGERDIHAVVASLPGDIERVVQAGDLVAIAFPPDGHTDALLAPRLRAAGAIAYVSSTGVYGAARGRIDGLTPTDPSTPKSAARLEAERSYLAVGAVVLRAPGIYGPGRGLHERIRDGRFRLPGDGSQAVSRIHVDDLAAFVVAALESPLRARVLAVGDDAPVPQKEVVEWLASRLGVPMPPAAPIDEVDETLRHDRRVDASIAKETLGVTLRYPSYREGFEACLAESIGGR